MMDDSVKKKKAVVRPKSQGFGTSIREIQNQTFKYTGSIRPGTQSPQKVVTDSTIMLPDYALDGKPKNKGQMLPWIIEVKTPMEIEKMREAGKVARQVLDIASQYVQPGITTDFIDEIVHAETIKRGAYPSPLNYHGFPKSCCTSVCRSLWLYLFFYRFHCS